MPPKPHRPPDTVPRLDPAAARPPYAVAAAVFVGVLAIYLVTLAPTTQFWDTSEYIAAAKVLGIPHPPGNPLFVLVAHVWGFVVAVGEYALRINLLAAVTSALASGFLFLVADRFLRQLSPGPRWLRYATAAAGVLVGATAFTVWHQSVVNEKVYTVSLFSIALVLWLTVRWGDQPPGERHDRWLILIAYLLALTSTNHLMGLLVTPAVLVYIAYTDPRVVTRWRMWAAVLVVVIVGLSVYTYLPIRAAHFPAINEGEPVTWQALQDVLLREQYQKPPLTDRQADLISQIGNYLQYFSWQFAHDLGLTARRILAMVFGGLGLMGALRHWQRDRRGAVAMITLMATVTVALVFYLNFKYGYSYQAPRGMPREVRERDYFFIASFHLWGVWVALGLATALEWSAYLFRERLPAPARWYPAAPVLLIALIPLLGNRLTASRAGETLARDFAWDLLQSVEPYGILITAGDNDTFPLWHLQEVEGVRRDVLVANLSLANTEWHPRQLKRRAVDPFDATRAIPPYRGRAWPMPTEDPLEMSFEAIDRIPGAQRLEDRRVFRVGNLRAVLDPRRLELPGWLQQKDLVTLYLIRDNLGERPIYFSRTTGIYPEQLGLGRYLLGHGLAYKLLPVPVDSLADPEIVRMPTTEWAALQRTTTLLFDVYHPEAAARDRPRGWVDMPSAGILQLYGLLYRDFALFAAERADSAGSELGRLGIRANRIAEDIFEEIQP